MPKWKAQDRTVCIRGTVVCGQAEDDAECGIIVDAHNAEIRTITAERDRLAAEISATNAAYDTLLESHELILDALTESDATLDRLREVAYPDGAVLTANQVCDKYFAMQDILYPPETTNDDR
jgi:glutamate synthase domain-containing protein 1